MAEECGRVMRQPSWMEMEPEPVGTGPIPAENTEMGFSQERRGWVRIVDRFMT
jgi:hypothetical protein